MYATVVIHVRLHTWQIIAPLRAAKLRLQNLKKKKKKAFQYATHAYI